MNPVRTYKLIPAEEYKLHNNNNKLQNLQDNSINENVSKLTTNQLNSMVNLKFPLLKAFKDRSKTKALQIINKMQKVGINIDEYGNMNLPNGVNTGNGVKVIKYIIYPQLLKNRKPDYIDYILRLMKPGNRSVNSNSGWISVYKHRNYHKHSINF